MKYFRIQIPDRNKHDIEMKERFVITIIDVAATMLLKQLTYCRYWKTTQVHHMGGANQVRTCYILEFGGASDSHHELAAKVANMIRNACTLDKILLRTYEVKTSEWLA